MADTASAALGGRRLAGDANHIRTKLVVGATAPDFAIATPNHAAYAKMLAAAHCNVERFKQRRTVSDGMYRAIPGVIRLRGKNPKAVIRHRFAGPESLQSREAVMPDKTAVDW